MRGYQIKIEKKEVDTKNKSFILESSATTATGSPLPWEEQELVDNLFLPHTLTNEDGDRITYFVKVSESQLFNELANLSKSSIEASLQKAFHNGEKHARATEVQQIVEKERYLTANKMQLWFAKIPWYKRLFYTPTILNLKEDVKKEGDDELLEYR